MESFVQITLEDYEKLKTKADSQNIPVNIGQQTTVTSGLGVIVETSKVEVKINMRELKLQICKQHGIDPENSVVEFY